MSESTLLKAQLEQPDLQSSADGERRKAPSSKETRNADPHQQGEAKVSQQSTQTVSQVAAVFAAVGQVVIRDGVPQISFPDGFVLPRNTKTTVERVNQKLRERVALIDSEGVPHVFSGHLGEDDLTILADTIFQETSGALFLKYVTPSIEADLASSDPELR